MNNEIKLIDANLVIESESNPRADFNETFIDGLAQSIARQGIINPITVAEANGGCYEVVCGAQRLRAFMLARERYGVEQKEIPCIVVDGKASRLAELRIVENMQRAQLTPAEEAAGVMSLIRLTDINGMPVYPRTADVAAALGVSVAWVRDRLAIAEMNENLEKQIDDLPVSVGREIARLPAGSREAVLKAYQDSLEDTDAEKLEDAIATVGYDLSDEIFYFNEALAGRSSCENCPLFVRGRYCLAQNGDCADAKSDAVRAEVKERLRKLHAEELLTEHPKAEISEKWEWALNIERTITDAAHSCGLPLSDNAPKDRKAPTLAEVIPDDYSGKFLLEFEQSDSPYEEKDGELIAKEDIGEFRGMTCKVCVPVSEVKKILQKSPAAALWLDVSPKSKMDKELARKKEEIRKECLEAQYREMRGLRLDDFFKLNFTDSADIRAVLAQAAFILAGKDASEVLRELGSRLEIEVPAQAEEEDYRKFFIENFKDLQILDIVKIALSPLFLRGMFGDPYNEIDGLPQGVRSIEELRKNTEEEFKYLQEYKLRELEKNEGGHVPNRC